MNQPLYLNKFGKAVIRHLSQKMRFTCFYVSLGNPNAVNRRGKNKPTFDCLIYKYHSGQVIKSNNALSIYG